MIDEKDKLTDFLKSNAGPVPEAPQDEFEQIVRRTQKAPAWKRPWISVPVAIAASVALFFWISASKPSEEGLEQFLTNTMGTVYTSDLDDVGDEYGLFDL